MVVEPPTRISFTGTRSRGTNSNVFECSIYNLSPNNYKKLVKDANALPGQFHGNDFTFVFEGGYEDNIGLIFAGQIHEANTVREGVDLITKVKSISGLHDIKHSFTSQSVSHQDITRYLMGNFNLVKEGKVSPSIPQLKRPKVLVGNTYKLLKDTYPDYDVFIDNNKCYVLNKDEVTNELIPIVDASTGLMGTPTRAQLKVVFDTLLNNHIQLGGKIDLQTVISTHLNGEYIVESIDYNGDNHSDNWNQTITTYKAKTNVA